MNNKRIIIGGGGTGGHVFPAISIGLAIRDKFPGTEILFVGAEGKLEMEKVPQAGFEIIGLPVAGLQRKLTLKNLSFPFRLWRSMVRSRKIIQEFAPDFAIGVGGYASGPILKAAASAGVPIAIQEQNSYAGLTNKVLARNAAAIFVAYKGMEKYFPAERIILTGNPVRKDIIDNRSSLTEAYRSFGLKEGRRTLLVIGGSLGSKTINESIKKHIDRFSDDLQVLWQTGKYYYDGIKSDMGESLKENIRIMPFISEMNHAFAIADVIISRAGAGTISELALAGKPVILVPSPNVAEDHQTKNAKALEEEGAAIIVKDEQAEETLTETAMSLLGDENKRKMMSEKLKKLALPDSTDRIVEEIFKRIK